MIQPAARILQAPPRLATRERGPVRIGQVVDALMVHYDLQPQRPSTDRRQVTRAAVLLGQQSLAELADAS